MGAAAAALLLKQSGQDVTHVRSTYDGRTYLVRRNSSSAAAADTLAQLNEKVQMLQGHLLSRYPEDERVRLLKLRYNPDALSEGGHNSGHTSYSEGKGRSIVMCLRSRAKDGTHGKIERMNTLVYVLLHELAHLATQEMGHTPTFWVNFDFIRDEARALGVYQEENYAANPAGYCGIVIKSGGGPKKN
jgi:hypothetical protein